MRQIALVTALIVTFVAPDSSLAQATPDSSSKAASTSQDKRFYKLDFTVKQIEAGKIINSRSYSVVLAGQRKASMRSGIRVPFKRDGNPDYLNVGLNIDCGDAVEVDGQLSLHIKAEMSSMAGSPENNSATLPALRQNQWESDVVFPLRKATTIFSSDDLASKQNVQLEILATPIR
ncbi:MAG: hypothetical protein JO028_22915 [Acidobacteriaceae bacterium]|nr:hypothetical protein [Acidobacteriaceae bacterium]